MTPMGRRLFFYSIYGQVASWGMEQGEAGHDKRIEKHNEILYDKNNIEQGVGAHGFTGIILSASGRKQGALW